LLERHANDTVIYPIIIKPCAWRAIDWLNRLQVRPLDGESVWRDNGRFAEQDLAEIALELAQIAGRRTEQSASFERPQSDMPLSALDSGARPIDFSELKRQAIAAIQVGAPEYNSGNVGACARRYARVVSLVQRNGIEGAVSPHVEATEVERPAFEPYGGWGSRLSPVWARNPLMRAGRYWMRLSRFLTTAASWSTSRTARLPRPFFMFAQAPSAGLSSGA
jgi:hypothetical protein